MSSSKPLSIAIDTVFFQHSYSGITRVWETLFKNFPSNSENANYQITILQRGSNSSYKFKPELNISKKFNLLQINEFNYMTMNQDVDYLNHLCKTNNFDVFISTYYTYCNLIPNIVLIHDMIPEVYKFTPNHMWIQKDKCIKNASSFISITNNTKNDLLKFYPHIKENEDLFSVEVIHNAISQFIDTPETVNNALLINNRIKPKSYILTMASNNEPYKNAVLITNLDTKYGKDIAKLLNNPTPIIMITNSPLPNGFKVVGNILYLSKVPDEYLNSLYKNALCFVCPSLYEGFGMPVFEAYARKVPVIAMKLPVFEELGSEGIHTIEGDISNNIDNLYEKIKYISNNDNNINNKKAIDIRVNIGYSIVQKYTEEAQIAKWNEYFTNLRNTVLAPKPFLNIILQTYNETNPDRIEELKYCVMQNLNNPYIKYIHDFCEVDYEQGSRWTESFEKHPKYKKPLKWVTIQNPDIAVNPEYHENKINENWLTYKRAFETANSYSKYSKDYGQYWCIINLDIFLDSKSNWNLITNLLNDNFIFAQSRHEFNILSDGTIDAKMDSNFAQMYHANTQDAWFFKTPILINGKTNIIDNNGCAPFDIFDFHLGYLGCDNAIADRLVKSGYKVINQPITYKIFHYDNIKGKTSSNYMEKHKAESAEKEKKQIKPKNKYPERVGSYLVPNYDQMMANGQDIDLIGLVRSLGGCSNWERYEFISKLFSERIMIQNP